VNRIRNLPFSAASTYARRFGVNLHNIWREILHDIWRTAGSGKLLTEMSQLASLSESARTVALNRFRILQTHLEQERFLTPVARDAGIPYRTPYRT